MSDLRNTTIVAVATPRGRGGIGIVRLSGPDSASVAQQIFLSSPPIGSTARQVQYGRFVDGSGTPVDTGLGWFLPAPSTYTGEDTVELSAHGSDVVLDLIVDAAVRAGADPAEPGEFTRRGFLNDRLDLLQAESVLSLIEAGSRREILDAYGASSGHLSQAIGAIRAIVLESLVQVEAALDFADEDIEPATLEMVEGSLRGAASQMEELSASHEGAKRRQEGWLVVLTGPTNVGKSTLLNQLAQQDRALVSPEAGTTRDWLETRIVWEGETLRLVDTAGHREGGGELERAGIERGRSVAGDADLRIGVLDRSEASSSAEMERLRQESDLVVLNKCDLPSAMHTEIVGEEGVLVVSARTGAGCEALRRAILARLPRSSGDGAVLLRERHTGLLREAAEALRRGIASVEKEPEKATTDLRSALGGLNELLGIEVGEEVLDRIFSQFCIGK